MAEDVLQTVHVLRTRCSGCKSLQCKEEEVFTSNKTVDNQRLLCILFRDWQALYTDLSYAST